jgi:hypothetical protein
MKIKKLIEGMIIVEGIADDFDSLYRDNERAALRRLTDYIADVCRPYLNDVGGLREALSNPLYRGMRGGSNVIVKSPRPAREPKDTDLFIHEMIVKAIDEAGGVANRDDSFFATRNKDVALEYGIPYYIFPVGRYNSTYLKGIPDFTQDKHFMLRKTLDALKMVGIPTIEDLIELRDELEYRREDDFESEDDLGDVENQLEKVDRYLEKAEEELKEEVAKRIVIDDISNLGPSQEVLLKAKTFIFVKPEIGEEMEYLLKRG